MTGGSATAILTYVRYHTDVEVAAAIRARHTGALAMTIADAELREILAGMRELAGTNPTMATGGFTGRRGGAAAPGRGGPAAAPVSAAPAAASGRSAGPATTAVQDVKGLPSTVAMVTGSPRTGVLLAQSDLSAVLLEGGRFTLLSKEGSAYREKPIAPKADWTHYDGSLTGNRFSTLELINATNVQRLGAAWVFPIAEQSARDAVTPVVQDGIMYVTGWNEIYALDATTGRQIWTYSEARHEGILSEGGIGTNRGVTLHDGRPSWRPITRICSHSIGSPAKSSGMRKWDRISSATAPPRRRFRSAT